MAKKIRRVRFEVPGPPIGYKTTTYGSKGFGKAYQKYVNYSEQVRFYARAAGIKLPLIATKDRPLMIRTVAYFKDGRHADPGNIQKGVVDALFYDKHGTRGKKTKKGDDKYTGGSFPPPRYDKDNPRVVIIIKDYEPKKKRKKKRNE